MERTRFLRILLVATAIYLVPLVHSQYENAHPFSISVSTKDVLVLVNGKEYFDLVLHGNLNENLTITFNKQHADLIDLEPSSVQFEANNTGVATITIIGNKPGSLEVTTQSIPNETWITKDVFLLVKVANSMSLVYISFIFGWIYFVAWSVSFYPQIYTNFRRKSVIGLNPDFLAMNLVGFLLYSVFNCGLYWIPEMQAEYLNRHPRGLNPVLPNDIGFSLHAVFVTLLTIFQCLIYERGEQKVSVTARGILAIFGITLVVLMGLALGDVIHWLDFIYGCSYIKLAITLIKYIPQALMNYRRKSTVGWSIGNILLDFIGGMLSMLQMIINAYNFDDWVSIFGDPTKFGLGLFSVLFDIFFMLQHYVFYRHSQEFDISHVTTVEDLSESKDDNSPRKKS